MAAFEPAKARLLYEAAPLKSTKAPADQRQ